MTDPAKQSRDEKDSDQRTRNARQSSETRIDREILPGVAERMASDIDAGWSIHGRYQLDVFVDLRQVAQAKEADDEAGNGKADKATRPAEHNQGKNQQSRIEFDPGGKCEHEAHGNIGSRRTALQNPRAKDEARQHQQVPVAALQREEYRRGTENGGQDKCQRNALQ